jgi:hypothetical protein
LADILCRISGIFGGFDFSAILGSGLQNSSVFTAPHEKFLLFFGFPLFLKVRFSLGIPKLVELLKMR